MPHIIGGQQEARGTPFSVGGFIMEVSYNPAGVDICMIDNDFEPTPKITHLWPSLFDSTHPQPS